MKTIEISVPEFFGGMFALGALAVWAALALTRLYKGRWQRKATVCFVLAVLFSPSLIVAGHGGVGVGFAWMTALQMFSTGWGWGVGKFFAYVLGPVVVTFACLFLVSIFLDLPDKSTPLNNGDGR